MAAEILERNDVAAEAPKMPVEGQPVGTAVATADTTPTHYTCFVVGEVRESFGNRPVVTEYDDKQWPYASEDDYDKQ